MAKGPHKKDFVSIEARTLRLLEDSPYGEARWTPPMDFYETEEELRIELHLPGVKIDDLEVNLYKDEIKIKGKRTMAFEEDVQFHRIERPFGIFERTINLPFRPTEDKIDASLKQGVLKIVIKKQTGGQR
jgi:HSP20 family protein